MPEWLWVVLVGGVIVGLAAVIWRSHETRDKERFDDIWNQIGRDSKSGMREVVHKTANQMSFVVPELDELKTRVERLEDDE